MVGQGRMALISIYSEFRGMPGGIKVEKGHQSPLPRPLPHDASDPLSLPSPAAQRQRLSLRLGGRNWYSLKTGTEDLLEDKKKFKN